MHRERASHRAVPRVSLASVRHQLRPASLDEAADVIVPAEVSLSALPTQHKVVESQVRYADPGEKSRETQFDQYYAMNPQKEL